MLFPILRSISLHMQTEQLYWSGMTVRHKAYDIYEEEECKNITLGEYVWSQSRQYVVFTHNTDKLKIPL